MAVLSDFYCTAQYHFWAKSFPIWNYFPLAMTPRLGKNCDYRSLDVLYGR